MSHHFQKIKKKRTFSHNEIANLKILKSMGYTIGRRIGEGTYSTVCVATRCLDNVQTKYACKVINRKNAEAEFIRRFLPRELQIIASLSHANIVTVSNIVEINDVIYMFMDYCKNGDLLEYIRKNGPLAERRAKHYFRQIVAAIEYLHRKNLAHRDIKCENILITNNHSIKLGDFGFARSCVNNQNGKMVLSETFCGSAAYAAPEILQGIPYGPKSYDIWALGCVLFIMMTASMPFDDTNIKRMLKAQVDKLASRQPCWSMKIKSPSLTNLLSILLEPTVEKRANIKEIANCHWLQQMQCRQCKRIMVSDTATI